MNKKIAIIGGGLFGITTYIVLKQNKFDCTLFEKNKDILLVSMSLRTSDWDHNRYKKFQMKFPINNWSKAPRSIKTQ